jgi:hypothetical protein
MANNESERDEMFKKTEAGKQSGQSPKAWCGQQNIAYHIFHYWYGPYLLCPVLRRHTPSLPAPSWTEIRWDCGGHQTWKGRTGSLSIPGLNCNRSRGEKCLSNFSISVTNFYRSQILFFYLKPYNLFVNLKSNGTTPTSKLHKPVSSLFDN